MIASIDSAYLLSIRFIKRFLISACLFISSSSLAQQLELTPFAGYMWGGDLRVYTGEIRGSDGMNYGLALNYTISEGTQLEGFWFLQSGMMNFKEYGQWEDENYLFDVNTNFIQFGVLKEMGQGNVFRPFGTFSLGTTIFNPSDSNLNSSWRFSISLGLGAKIYFSDRIGFRLQSRFLMPMYASGAGVWCGTGGCRYGIAATTVVAQADVTGGIIIVLK